MKGMTGHKQHLVIEARRIMKENYKVNPSKQPLEKWTVKRLKEFIRMYKGWV